MLHLLVWKLLEHDNRLEVLHVVIRFLGPTDNSLTMQGRWRLQKTSCTRLSVPFRKADPLLSVDFLPSFWDYLRTYLHFYCSSDKVIKKKIVRWQGRSLDLIYDRSCRLYTPTSSLNAEVLLDFVEDKWFWKETLQDRKDQIGLLASHLYIESKRKEIFDKPRFYICLKC